MIKKIMLVDGSSASREVLARRLLRVASAQMFLSAVAPPPLRP